MSLSLILPRKAKPVKKKKQGSPEKDIRAKIIGYLLDHGWFVMEVNAGMMRTEWGGIFYPYTLYGTRITEPVHGGMSDLIAFKGFMFAFIETKAEKGSNVQKSQHRFVDLCNRFGLRQYRIWSLEQAQQIDEAYSKIHSRLAADESLQTLLNSLSDVEGQPEKKRAPRRTGESAEQILFGTVK